MKESKSKFLILAPHPDDEVVGTCILIKRGVQFGHEFYIFFLTNGCISKNELWYYQKSKHNQRLNRRLNEMKKTTELLKIERYFLQNIPSRTLRNNINETIKKISEIIKTYKITTLLAPAYEGGHQDHDVANFIASRFRNCINVLEFSEYNYFNKTKRSNKFIEEFGNEKKILLNENEIKFKKMALNIYQSEKKNLTYIKVKEECYRNLVAYNYNIKPHEGKLFYQRFNFFSWHPRVDGTNPMLICKILKDISLQK